MKNVVITNTPRPGDTPEQIAARTAPRIQIPRAKLAFVTQPSPGTFLLNIDDGKKFTRLEITRAQLGNLVVDGAHMTLRSFDKPEAIEASATGKQWLR